MGVREARWPVLGCGVHVLAVGDPFVEIDSYAIVLRAACVAWAITRWGLFLMRGGSQLFFLTQVHSLWESGGGFTGLQRLHSGSSLMGRYLFDVSSVLPQMLCRRSWTRACSGDDYQIESSTDVCPCKKRCHFMSDTNCVMVSDEHLKLFHFVHVWFLLLSIWIDVFFAGS